MCQSIRATLVDGTTQSVTVAFKEARASDTASAVNCRSTHSGRVGIVTGRPAARPPRSARIHRADVRYFDETAFAGGWMRLQPSESG